MFAVSVNPRRLAALAAVVALLSAGTALAQDKAESAVLSDGQKMLINEGAKASDSGDFKKAIRLLQVSLDLGPINVTYLNLGRALQKNNQCDEARHAYEKALLAPAVAQPSPDKVRDIITRYRKELAVVCPGVLVVTCSPEKTTIRVDDGAPRACNGTPISLKPGKHTIKGEASGIHTTENVVIKAFEESHIRLVVQRPVLVDAREHFRVADGWMTSGQLDRARTKFLEAHMTAPHWGPPMFKLGQIALRQRNYIDAIKWLERHRPYAHPSDVPALDRLVSSAEQQLNTILKAHAKTPKKSSDQDKASSNK